MTADLYLHHFRDAVISSPSSSLIADGRAVIDGLIDACGERFDYSQGQLKRHRRLDAVVRLRRPISLSQGIFFAGNGCSNYYHWLVEILPRAEFLDSLPVIYSKYSVLVDRSVLELRNFREMLEIFIPERTIVPLDSTNHYMVQSLVYIETPNQMPYNLNGEHKLCIGDTRMDPRSIKFIRERTLATLGKGMPESPARVFLARKGTRRNYNQGEVEDHLRGFGFTTVYMEELSFLDQVNLMQQAQVVAGPTGAAWANLVFAAEGLKCICWMAEENEDFSAFSTIAETVGADLRYIRYKSHANSTFDLYSKNYNLEVCELTAALADLAIKPTHHRH